MRLARRAVAVFGLLVFFSSSAVREADAQRCLPTFGYGNVGYAAGYSFSQVGWCGPRFGGGCLPAWGGGWCGPRAGWCGPGFNWGCRPWGWRRWCAPPVYGCGYGYGGSYGWPAWYGTTWFPSCGSVWMGAPFGGSFFSGAIVPYPTIGYPVVVPGFVSSRPSVPSVATLASARPRVMRAAVSPSARLRAARLVATGDRQLRESGGDPAKLRRAADAYRRAAVIAADQPDTYIRQAMALVALGERGQADAALAKATAIDGRLADAPVRRGGTSHDPVFGDRPAGAPSPLATRGQVILQQIAGQAAPVGGDDAPALAALAARWAERFGAAPATVPLVQVANLPRPLAGQ